MGRECRRVPADWVHPEGRHLLEYDATYLVRDGYGGFHQEDEMMPNWPEAACTHYQMYENTTEGTPISPVFATPEEVARWCVDNGVSSFGRHGRATYEQWLAVARGESAPSLIIDGRGVMRSGVEAMSPPDDD